MTAAISVGNKCIKKKGRDAGEEVEITKLFDSNFVLIKNGKGKESKCAILHLEPKA